MSYDWREVTWDGPVQTQRRLHHAIKIGYHTGVVFALLVFGVYPVWAGAIGGPVFWLALVAKETIWPSDPEPLTVWQHVADWLTDSALSCVPYVGALLLSGHVIGAWIATAYALVAYTFCHHDARP